MPYLPHCKPIWRNSRRKSCAGEISLLPRYKTVCGNYAWTERTAVYYLPIDLLLRLQWAFFVQRYPVDFAEPVNKYLYSQLECAGVYVQLISVHLLGRVVLPLICLVLSSIWKRKSGNEHSIAQNEQIERLRSVKFFENRRSCLISRESKCYLSQASFLPRICLASSYNDTVMLIKFITHI